MHKSLVLSSLCLTLAACGAAPGARSTTKDVSTEDSVSLALRNAFKSGHTPTLAELRIGHSWSGFSHANVSPAAPDASGTLSFSISRIPASVTAHMTGLRGDDEDATYVYSGGRLIALASASVPGCATTTLAVQYTLRALPDGRLIEEKAATSREHYATGCTAATERQEAALARPDLSGVSYSLYE